MDKQILKDIREGKIDINNQELFFSTLIKGLMLRLDDDIFIRNIPVPHIIVHTGSDALYLERKGHDYSIEPYSISNESYIYNIVPRCVVNPGGIDIIPDQLTNPYSLGYFQYENDDNIYTLAAEFRRVPVKLTVELKYLIDSFRDMLELTQQILTKLYFIRTFDIIYLGQNIKCSYKIPESFSSEYMTEMDGKTQDDKYRVLNLSLEVETNIPVISQRSIMPTDHYITGNAIFQESKYKTALKIRNGEIDREDVSQEIIDLADDENISNELLKILDTSNIGGIIIQPTNTINS